MNAHNQFGRSHKAPSAPTAAVPAHPLTGAAASPNDGYGKQPRCETCGGGFYGCLCTAPEPDVMHVSDMRRVMPELFGLPSGWTRIEL